MCSSRDVIGDVCALRLHFLERLQDELPVDEVIHGLEADFLDLLVQRLPLELLVRGFFLGGDQLAHLGKSDDVVVHHRSHPIEHILSAAGGKERGREGQRPQRQEKTTNANIHGHKVG